MDIPDIPPFLLRGHPDCVAGVVDAPKKRQASLKTRAARINREAAKMMAKAKKNRARKAKAARRARKLSNP